MAPPSWLRRGWTRQQALMTLFTHPDFSLHEFLIPAAQLVVALLQKVSPPPSFVVYQLKQSVELSRSFAFTYCSLFFFFDPVNITVDKRNPLKDGNESVHHFKEYVMQTLQLVSPGRFHGSTVNLQNSPLNETTSKKGCFMLFDTNISGEIFNLGSFISSAFMGGPFPEGSVSLPGAVTLQGAVALQAPPGSIDTGIITYIGLGVSFACLLATLIIETIIWKSVVKKDTVYMRHVCLVNIAVSLLLADIWFLINRANSDFIKPILYFLDLASNVLIFFFFMCFSFWILVIGLFLFYRVIFILHKMSRKAVLIAAFSVGYGCPLLISVILVTSVVPREAFASGNFTWFETSRTRVVLSFLLPVLTISFLNLIILLVVIYKLVRSPKGMKRTISSRKIIIQIINITAVLTPVSSVTWGISLGMFLDNGNVTLQWVYFAFHAFQGVFILLFNVLPNKRAREALRGLWSNCRLSKQKEIEVK
ncbi:adhesion G protein-coupled receptor F5 [Xenopus laevis]|uniref:Adhesion G protein-coupled receptor F5 n=2 Tax=Xenopus laevis TaxID=8355 RepID=A0A8J1KV24_XENLA|nr:adhesion G protein-coupled receptor F5 [Xenopus laevis]